ncbi:MAG: hypothetical protein QXE05_12705 [Nitrososphaeria archaeon]
MGFQTQGNRGMCSGKIYIETRPVIIFNVSITGKYVSSEFMNMGFFVNITRICSRKVFETLTVKVEALVNLFT